MVWRCGLMKGEIKYCSRFNADGTFEKNVIAYGYKILESHVEPEETPNFWRFKLTLKPKDAIKFEIKERKEDYSSYYLYNYTKEDLLKRVAFYVQQKFINPELEAQLKEIGELIGLYFTA